MKEKPKTLVDAIAQMMVLADMTEEQHNAIMNWEEFNLKLHRTALTKEKAQRTFSIDAIVSVTTTFHLWLLGRIKQRWEDENWNTDKAPKALSIKGVIDWSDDI